MISVIIPTMWLAEGLLDRLHQLSLIAEVGEIILIDNSETPPDLEIPKLVHIREYKNTYVNPAWNKGVELSKHDRLCIMNDDIGFEDDLFSQVEPHISEDKGMIGLYEFDGVPYRDEDKLFKLVDTKRWRGMGYACLFFIHKKSYVEIPEMKIWYGDDYLFHCNTKTNYYMANANVWGTPSITSRNPIFDPIKQRDSEIYQQLLERE